MKRINQIRILFAMLAMLVSSVAHSDIRNYSASVNQSQWRVKESSRLQCSLAHPIPGYGEAVFTALASKKLNMEFELDMLRLPDTYGIAKVYSVPPRWVPGGMQKTIADMRLRRQFDGDLPKQAAWTMLTELEKGYVPTIFYEDWDNPYDKVTVGLNAANFNKHYTDFVTCVSNLLPFSFEDISYTVLTYEFNSTELTKTSKRRLAMISEYLKEDSDMELVLVDGYSDSFGGSFKNKEISIQRAVETKAHLKSLGVTSQLIDVTGHGERRHIAPNDDEFTRPQNRRVIIRMSKS